jgi:nitrous oxidase accessory protein NosD
MANCSISWDSGGKGNFWSNYDGTDSNDDGIGDIPYIIGGANKDNYPLMKPVVIPTQTPEPSAESLPATTILAASAVVAIIGIGLFAYFKKRH